MPHEHTEDCYTEVQTLTCMEEEHVHGDDCFDPEDGTLICEKFEHTHDESCYGEDGELQCSLPESEAVEEHHHRTEYTCFIRFHFRRINGLSRKKSLYQIR